LKKHIAFILLSSFSLFYPFFGSSQLTIDKKSDGISVIDQQKIAHFYELIISDVYQAEKEIDKYKKKIENSQNSNLKIEILAVEAEMYRSKGDYVHMKLSLYQTLSFKDKNTGKYQLILLKHLSALNEGVKENKKIQEKLLKECLATAKKNNFKFLEGKANYSLGKFYTNESNYKKSKEHLTTAMNIFQSLGYKNLNYETKMNFGICLFWEGKYDESLKVFHETKAYASNLNQKKCYTNSLLNLGEAHLYIDGNSDSAKFYFNQFLALKDQADIRDVFHCYWNLEEYYLLKKNKDSAYHYLKLAYEVDNEIKDTRRNNNVKEIDLLYKKVQNQRELEDEKKHQELLKVIFGLSGAFLILVVLVFIYIVKEKSKLNTLLQKQNDDITQQQEIVNTALKEKELLLKEIHHRVKNNLQIVSSLLSLQSKNMTDEKAKYAIFEAKERISAIALIHQKLYSDKTFATIDMNTYLEDLILQLSNSYNDKKEHIKINLKSSNVVLGIDTVVPLGLILCELITNAFKYAFVNKSEGNLKLEINHGEDDSYILTVKDDGSGMAENFSFLESKTLGVEIITALTEQLDGKLSYKSDSNGTTIKVKFKEIKN
jgi:two-component system, sensor histidine kinase PdtaS